MHSSCKNNELQNSVQQFMSRMHIQYIFTGCFCKYKEYSSVHWPWAVKITENSGLKLKSYSSAIVQPRNSFYNCRAIMNINLTIPSCQSMFYYTCGFPLQPDKVFLLPLFPPQFVSAICQETVVTIAVVSWQKCVHIFVLIIHNKWSLVFK